MKFFACKRLFISVTLIFLFSASVSSTDFLKVRKFKDKYRYTDIEQVDFVTSGKYSPHIDKNTQQSEASSTQSTYINSNSNNYSYPDYTNRAPFDGAAPSLVTPTSSAGGSVIMRATNDDELPGDPGQMPLTDGLWLLLGAAVVYTFYKKLKTLTR